jgi:hypothetical protein
MRRAVRTRIGARSTFRTAVVLFACELGGVEYVIKPLGPDTWDGFAARAVP